jgi:tripartite-type tricarboxylate transporter receptor subunit TctC
MQRRTLLAGAAAASVASPFARAQQATSTGSGQAWPGKPVKIIVPFPAGTVTDTTTRILLPALSAGLGQPVVVDNRAGADGAIGAQEVARAAPDGYTLLMSTNGFCAIPALRRSPPYDPLKDFTPVSMVARFSFFLFVNSTVPARSVAELMDLARAKPGELNYATGNPTGIVASSQMLSIANAKMVHVPYKGEPAAMTDLVSNRVQVMFATMTTAGPHVEAGRLRMLATTLPQRSPAFPNIPTMPEAGVTNFAVASWAALQGPAGMPREIAQRVSREVAAAHARPEIREALLKQNIIPGSSTPDELGSYVRSQVELYAKTLREAGVQPE